MSFSIGTNDITLYKEMDGRGEIIDDQDDGADLTGKYMRLYMTLTLFSFTNTIKSS